MKEEEVIVVFKKKLLGVKLLVLVGVFFALSEIGGVAYADTAINLSIDTPTLSFDLLPTSAAGSFAKSNNATILVSTNSPTGYELAIKAGTTGANAQNLVNSTTDTTIQSFNSLAIPETAVTEANFKALANTKYNGMWGFLPSKYNSSANSDFIVAPDSNGALIDSTSAPNETTANQYTLAIGARVDASTKLGLYSNTYVITAVANGTSYSLIYNDNVVSNMPNDKISMTSASSVNLADNTPTRDGYEFIGWCLGTSTSSNITTVGNTDTCSTTVYQPGASIAVTSGSANDKYLYAMWQIPAPTKLWFQNATSADCGETMYDNRGTDAYKEIGYSTATINGLCWMTRNLDLPAGTTITSSDSNIAASSFTLPADSTSFDSTTTPQVHNTNSTNCGDNSPCYSYYNYPAATAGTNPSSGAASSDICPSGWRLPTSAELTALKNTYTTGATLTAAPFLGVYAGNYRYGDFYNGGSYGYYWSSTANDSVSAYVLYFGSSYADVYDGNKGSGSSVRCVARQ